MPAIGKASYLQLPAGMADGKKDKVEVALREMAEETGLAGSRTEIVDLAARFYEGAYEGVYPSPGVCDEMVHLFLQRKRVSEKMVERMRGHFAGLGEEEHEHLIVRVVRLEELPRLTTDVKALSAFFMYKTLKDEGKLK